MKKQNHLFKETNHLISFKKKWNLDRESFNGNQRIISAKKINNFDLIDVSIFHLNDEFKLIEK